MNANAEAQAEDHLTPFREAVSEDLMTLAVLHDRELDKPRILALWDIGYDNLLGLKLSRDPGKRAMALFCHGMTDIPGILDQEALDLLAAEYADIYLNNSLGASPNESVWLDDDGLMMQEPMFQIREWYLRHGLAVPDWRNRTDDHLVHQLQFLAHLLAPGMPEADLAHAARFMDEHLLRWIGDFADRVATRCSTRLYAGLARLTAAYVDELRDILAELCGEPRPSPEQVEARMKPKISLPVAGPGPFLPGAAPSW